jgi:integrase
MQPDFGDLAGVWKGSEMALHLLTARQVQTVAVGDHADGAGLFLRVTDRGASWVFRFTAPDGRRREMGLGSAMRDTLAAAGQSAATARKAAERARGQLADKVDPIEQRKSDRDSAQKQANDAKAVVKAERTTLARVARQYHEKVIEPQRSDKHSAQWIASLEQGVPATIWHKPIDQVQAPELLDALAVLQLRVPETAARVRQRLEVVFDDAIFHSLCVNNPARTVKRKLAERPKGCVKGNFAALPYEEVPAFTKALRLQAGTAARCLEFALLCAARTGEVLGATWDEVDTAAGVWRIPGERMKGGEAHTVFLPPRAIEIAEAMRELGGDPFVFPSATDRKKPLSNMAMLTLLRRMGVADSTTVHGLCRSSFSTWANDTAAARPDVVEAALAHREADKVRAAYNRASFNAERRALLLAWARYCAGEQSKAVEQPAATVHQLPTQVAA